MAAKLYTFPKNPRAFRILIAAHYSGAQIEVIDDPAQFKLGVTNKSQEFLAQFPFGKVPAFVTADGQPIYESNAIASYVAGYNGALSASNAYDAALIQQYINLADHEVYPAACTWVYPVFGIIQYNKNATEKAKADVTKVLSVLNQVLATKTFLVGERVTLADITLVTSLVQLYENVLDVAFRAAFPHTNRWFVTCVNQPEFKAVLGEVKLAETMGQFNAAAFEANKNKTKAKESGKEEKKEAKKETKKEEKKEEKEEKKEAAKPAKKAEEEEDGGDEFLSEEEKKPSDPLAHLPKSPFDLDHFKRTYSNEDTPVAIEHFWKNFDKAGYSIWKCDYNYSAELTLVFMTCNLINGMYQRVEKLRKYAFASMCVFGTDNNNKIGGVWITKGQDLVFDLAEDWNVDAPSYTWRKIDADSEEAKTLVQEYFTWEGTFADQNGLKFNQGKIFK